MTKPWLGKVGALFIQKRGCIVSTHPHMENGEEKEIRASDFKNWEVTGFKYPGYLEELEEIAVNAYRWNSHDPETRAETDIMGYEKQLHEDLKKIPEAKKTGLYQYLQK